MQGQHKKQTLETMANTHRDVKWYGNAKRQLLGKKERKKINLVRAKTKSYKMEENSKGNISFSILTFF